MFSKSISGAGLRTILPVPLRQQADEPFDVRLHFTGAPQAEFLSRAALPEFEHGLVTGIRTLRLIAEGVVIDRNLCGLCHPNARPQRFCEPTYNGPESRFWTCFLLKNCRAFKRARLQRFATVCDKLRHIPGVTAICNRLQRSATARKPGPIRIGSKDPVVEHKGSVERGGVFSLVTSARSVVAAVGQTALSVRPMFDAEIPRQKNAGNSRDVLLTDRTKTECSPNRSRTEAIKANRANPKPTGLGMVSFLGSIAENRARRAGKMLAPCRPPAQESPSR